MNSLQPVYIICQREFIKFFREKSRCCGTLARPVLWLVVVGSGMSTLIKPQPGFNYLQFIFPGMIGITIMFSAILSSSSIVSDREFGFMKEMLVAPISRLSIVFGKAISGVVISVLQAVIILIFIPLLGLRVTAAQVAWIFAAAVLVSFCLTSMGIMIAACITSFDGYHAVMNFLVMPMFLLSGAMYPVTSMPEVLRQLAYLNPVTYCVDVFKHILLTKGAAPGGPDFSLAFDLLIVVALSVVTMTLAVFAFKQKA